VPKPKDPNDDRDRRGREGDKDKRGEHPAHGEEGSYAEKGQPRRRRMGREHAVHQKIVEKRLGGGAPATPDAYAEALKEWQKLPGSVVRPPTDEKLKQDKPKQDEPKQDKPAAQDNTAPETKKENEGAGDKENDS
jgi:hypothetical protein